MTNPIRQWLEGKKKGAEEHPMLDYEGSPVKIYNDTFAQTFDELIAGTPSLLSAMEVEIKGRIGPDNEYSYDSDSEACQEVEESCEHHETQGEAEAGGENTEKHRIVTIIHDYFNHIRG